MAKINNDAQNQHEKAEVQIKFGQKLASLRSIKKITQENLALELGVDRTYISYIERGKRNPSLYFIWRIAKTLNISISELTNLI